MVSSAVTPAVSAAVSPTVSSAVSAVVASAISSAVSPAVGATVGSGVASAALPVSFCVFVFRERCGAEVGEVGEEATSQPDTSYGTHAE